MYYFYTQEHFKIWLNPKDDDFLPFINQLRLIRFRHNNPTARLVYIYNSQRLNKDAKKNLHQFCTTHAIELCDFDTDIWSLCKETLDRKHYDVAIQERDALINNRGGDAGAYSDHVRILLLNLLGGMTYSDFDTKINVKDLDPIVTMQGPILLDLGSIESPHKETLWFNNHMIGVARTADGLLHPEAKKILEDVQRFLIDLYENGALKALKMLLDDNQVHYKTSPLLIKVAAGFPLLEAHYPEISIPQFRYFLKQSTKNIFSMLRLILDPKEVDANMQSSEAYTKLIRALSNENYDDFPEDMFPQEEIAFLKQHFIDKIITSVCYEVEMTMGIIPLGLHFCLVSEDADEVFRDLMTYTEAIQVKAVEESVTLLSGGQYAFHKAGVLNLSSPSQHESIAFSGNNLGACFTSNQSLPFKTPYENYQKGRKNKYENGDLSWHEKGQEKMAAKHAAMHASAEKIQVAYKKHRFRLFVAQKIAARSVTSYSKDSSPSESSIKPIL